jgi:hypothetical protein
MKARIELVTSLARGHASQPDSQTLKADAAITSAAERCFRHAAATLATLNRIAAARFSELAEGIASQSFEPAAFQPPPADE